MPATTFGALLQRLREQAGLSQSGLADRAGVPTRTIQNWEQGHREPRPGALITLGRALGVEPVVLLATFEEEGRGVERPTGRQVKGGNAEGKRRGPKAGG
jgi:transcriptional regulator with XRE-family HTH domain